MHCEVVQPMGCLLLLDAGNVCRVQGVYQNLQLYLLSDINASYAMRMWVLAARYATADLQAVPAAPYTADSLHTS
jgi:hypothetical protein